MKILITGTCGFIGYSLAESLLKKNNIVYGIDNLNDYYSVSIKKLRLKNLKQNKNFIFKKIDISNRNLLFKFFRKKKIDIIFNFAAQAGVRYSLIKPDSYFFSNLIGFLNICDLAKSLKVKKVFFASSSSVYGDAKKYPVKESFDLNPKNIYGLTKKMNEISAKTLSLDGKIKFIGLRFFTVFGEWGRPDMMLFKVMESYQKNLFFYLNDSGKHFRDFTYIQDVVSILNKLIKVNFKNNFQLFNVCSNRPIKVIKIINEMQNNLQGLKIKNVNPKILKKIEVNKTHGDNKKILNLMKEQKFTNFSVALKNTIDWYMKNKIYKIT
jgi:UDP-glucuronate 4-epimerase